MTPRLLHESVELVAWQVGKLVFVVDGSHRLNGLYLLGGKNGFIAGRVRPSPKRRPPKPPPRPRQANHAPANTFEWRGKMRPL